MSGAPRLGLFLNIPMEVVGRKYSARYPHLFDFFLDLASHTSRTTLTVPLRRADMTDPEHGDVSLPENVDVLGLPRGAAGPSSSCAPPWCCR